MKEHYVNIAVIIAVSVFFMAGSFNLTELSMVDHSTTYLPRAEILRQSVFEYGDFFPLWNPYIMSGTPLYANAVYAGFDSPIMAVLTLFNNSVAAVKVNYIFDIILAGIFMYIFGNYLFKDRKIALFVAILYMLNGFAVRYFTVGALSTLNQYPFVPLTLLFLMKAFKTKKWQLNSVIMGILLAIQLRAGSDMKVMLWSSLMFGLYGIFYVFAKNPKKRLTKMVMIFGIVLIVFVGLSAQKVLVVKEYLDDSSRGQLSYEQSSGRKVKLDKMFFRLVEPLDKGLAPFKDGVGEHIGIFAFLLACLAIMRKIKNKFTLFLTSTALLSLLAASGTFVYFLLWKFYPGFSSMRYLERGLFIFVFPMILLAGQGLQIFLKRFEKRKRSVAFYAILLLIIVNLGVFGFKPWVRGDVQDIDKMIQSNEILDYISTQPGHFRIHVYETRGIDWGTEFYNIRKHVQNIYGYETAWFPPYFSTYLGLGMRQPAKMWGILNTKYVTSMEPINISGLKFLQKFNKCEICPLKPLEKAHGPYLYENQMFMPRAYITENSVLVVGKEDVVTQITYTLLLDPNYSPKNVVIISGKEKISDYSIEELQKYSAIFVGEGALGPESQAMLSEYDGLLIPNILEKKFAVSQLDIDELWDHFDERFTAIPDKDYEMINFDTYEIHLDSQNGFLVLSEKFSQFSGWKAKADGKELEIETANGVITAVYHDGTTDITFDYKPKSFVIGSAITYLTLLLVVAYFIFLLYKKRKNG